MLRQLWMVSGTNSEGITHVAVLPRYCGEDQRLQQESEEARGALQRFARRLKRGRSVFGRMAQVKAANSAIPLCPGVVYAVIEVEGKASFVATETVIETARQQAA